MKTQSFDAVIVLQASSVQSGRRAEVIVDKSKTKAEIKFYKVNDALGNPYVSIFLDKAVNLFWQDKFEVQGINGEKIGQGVCLNPGRSWPAKAKPARIKAWLDRLNQGPEEMIYVLVEMAGLNGLQEAELDDFARLSKPAKEKWARYLEETGKVRILTFMPLNMVSRNSLEFMKDKIVAFLRRYHHFHASHSGVSLEKIEQRFGVSKTIFNLAVKLLQKEGQVELDNEIIRLKDFKAILSEEEQKRLGQLQEMITAQPIGNICFREAARKLRLTPAKLSWLLQVLVEQKKIVCGRDGFYINSAWLEEIAVKLRKSGQRQLSVGEFKKLTGLTRKYAVPLLELLDQAGVTRRKGSSREILPGCS